MIDFLFLAKTIRQSEVIYVRVQTGELDWPFGETQRHNRELLFGIEILDRMIARDGYKSDFLEVSQKPGVKINYR